jgi:hypothetical protein
MKVRKVELAKASPDELRKRLSKAIAKGSHGKLSKEELEKATDAALKTLTEWSEKEKQ